MAEYTSKPETRTYMEVIHNKNYIIIHKEVSIPIGEDVYEAIGRIYGELEGELFEGRFLSPTERALSDAEGMKSHSTIEIRRDDPMVPVLESITRAMRRLGGLHGSIWPGYTDKSYSKQGYDWAPRIYTSSKFPPGIAGQWRTFRFNGYSMFDSLTKYKFGVNILVEDLEHPDYDEEDEDPKKDAKVNGNHNDDDMEYEESDED